MRKGVPIYDCPGVDFDFSIWTMAGFPRFAYVMWLGLGFALEETAPGSNVFDDGYGTTLTFLEPPLGDPSVQEQVSVIYTPHPYYGISNVLYTCTETAEDSPRFENDLHGVVFTKNPLTGKAQLDISTMYSSDYAELTETSAGSGIYTGGN